MPAATRGVRERTVFHTWPLVSRTLRRPAMKRVRKPRPAKETILVGFGGCGYLKNGHWGKNGIHL